MPPRTETKSTKSSSSKESKTDSYKSSSKESKTDSYKSSAYLSQKAAGYMLASANAAKRESGH